MIATGRKSCRFTPIFSRLVPLVLGVLETGGRGIACIWWISLDFVSQRSREKLFFFLPLLMVSWFVCMFFLLALWLCGSLWILELMSCFIIFMLISCCLPPQSDVATSVCGVAKARAREAAEAAAVWWSRSFRRPGQIWCSDFCDNWSTGTTGALFLAYNLESQFHFGSWVWNQFHFGQEVEFETRCRNVDLQYRLERSNCREGNDFIARKGARTDQRAVPQVTCAALDITLGRGRVLVNTQAQ